MMSNSVEDIFRENRASQILIFGIGNPARQDDALGIVFVEMLRKWAEEGNLRNLSFDSNYQLNIEDAHDISLKDVVVFADASVEPSDGFSFRRIFPANQISVSTHSMSPESVLSLCAELYGKSPLTFLMTIRGYSWDLDGAMTDKAVRNMDAALEFCKGILIV